MMFRLVLILMLYLPNSIIAQDEILSKTDISLLTCEVGDELYSTFGHTAIRIRNDSLGTDIVYNYGTFDFNTPNFYLKFLRGKLPYRLAASTIGRFLNEYQIEKRSVYEQKLNLTVPQKISFARYLMNNIRKDNAYYKYDFFFDNCTTRTIDAITNSTGKVDYNKPLSDITFRGMIKENLTNMKWSEFGIDLIIGAVADQKTNRRGQHFLPLYLYKDVDQVSVVNNGMRENLVKEEVLLLNYERERERRQKDATNWPIILFGSLLLLEIFLFFRGRKKASTSIIMFYDKTWIILMSVLGLVMAIMWWGTDHMATKSNWNLLWANLLFIAYLFAGKSVKNILSIILIACCSIAFLNSLFQFLPQYFLPSFGLISLVSVLKLLRIGHKSSLVTV